MNNSSVSMNPDGGDDVWRDDIKPALDNLMARILERDNVQRAWERVQSNKGAPGASQFGDEYICLGELGSKGTIEIGTAMLQNFRYRVHPPLCSWQLYS